MEIKLFSIIRDEVKAGNYKSEQRYAFIEKVKEKYFTELGSIDYQNLYETAKVLRDNLLDFIVNGKQIVSDWDNDDIKYVFLYQVIIDNMIEEVGVIVKPIPMVADTMSEEDIQLYSDKLQISEDEIKKMNLKQLSEAYIKKDELMSMKEDLEIDL